MHGSRYAGTIRGTGWDRSGRNHKLPAISSRSAGSGETIQTDDAVL